MRSPKAATLAATLAVLLATSAAHAQNPYDYADDMRPDPFWASRAFSDHGTRIRNTPRYRYYSTRYRHWRHHRERHVRWVYRPRYHHPSYVPPVAWRGRDYHPATRVYGYVSTSPDVYARREEKCRAPVEAAGVERGSEEAAKSAAIQAWMTQVMPNPGVIYADVVNAILSDDELLKTPWRHWFDPRKPLGFQCFLADAGTRVIDKAVTRWIRREQLQKCVLRAVPCKPEPDSTLPEGVERRQQRRDSEAERRGTE